jgi:peptide/nickel transport system permease protein
VARLACGYQASGLVQTDGNAYLWGNTNAVRNLASLNARLPLMRTKELVFTNSVAVALSFEGEVELGDEGIFQAAVSSKNGYINSFNAYMVGRKAVEIAANNKCLALVLEDGELVVAGAFENGEDLLPAMEEGEYFTSLDGGTRHFVGVTNFGRAYAWGDNGYGQCDIDGKRAARVYAGALQSYVVDGEGKLVQSAGLKGYIMGTDGRGRDVFARIVHGGKMTLTIGGVAVLVSSTIAILVGCVAGYFGGWVDLLLMRITEIFSAIPFLPFAMLLSQIIKNYNVSETTRIFIIMLILGALSWTGLARMIRGQVLAEREKEFVTAARAMGVREGKIAFRHVLPNVVSVILVSMTLDFAGCLLTESSLSYLGFGV